MMRQWACLGGVVMMAAGVACQTPPHARINAPPQGYTEYVNPVADLYRAMAANALAIEMRVTDEHFKPNSPTLNDAGRFALAQMAGVLQTEGGPLYYRSETAGKELYAARVSSVRHYLTTVADVPADRIEIVKGYARLPQMDAVDAVAIMNNAHRDLSGGGGAIGGGPTQPLIGTGGG